MQRWGQTVLGQAGGAVAVEGGDRIAAHIDEQLSVPIEQLRQHLVRHSADKRLAHVPSARRAAEPDAGAERTKEEGEGGLLAHEGRIELVLASRQVIVRFAPGVIEQPLIHTISWPSPAGDGSK